VFGKSSIGPLLVKHVKRISVIVAVMAGPFDAEGVDLHAQAGFSLVGSFAKVRAAGTDRVTLALAVISQPDAVLLA
jgi:hypothetical protein